MNDNKTTTMTSKTWRVQDGKARGCQSPEVHPRSPEVKNIFTIRKPRLDLAYYLTSIDTFYLVPFLRYSTYIFNISLQILF